MRISKAEGREVDIVLILGFDLVKMNKGFEDDREGRRGSFPARLREIETKIERWQHDQSENINRTEAREMAGKLYERLFWNQYFAVAGGHRGVGESCRGRDC